MSKNLLDFDRYLLVIPHPDDEVNCCALLQRIIHQGKNLEIALITNGSSGINAQQRNQEFEESLDKIGFSQEHLHALNIPEDQLFQSFTKIYEQISAIIGDFQPDCLITLDFDGGHEGHDSSNFLAHQAIQGTEVQHIVFPDYHFRNMQRHGLEFMSGRQTDFTLNLTEEEKDLKIALLEAHAGQIRSYLKIQKTQPNYFELMFSREIYRAFPNDFNYLDRPAYQIGYEYHRNGFKFEDYLSAAKTIALAR